MLDTYWSNLLDLSDPLVTFRKKGWDRFEELGLPKTKQEAFQYLLLKPVFPPLAERQGIAAEPKQGLTFVDGFFEEFLSEVPKPLVCSSLKKSILSYGLFLQSRMNRTLKEETDPFAALNSAFQGEGAFLYVPPKCKAALHLRHIFTGQGFSSPRVHIYLGRGAELKLTQTSEGHAPFCNSVIDFVLDDGAKAEFIDHATGHFQALRASCKRDAKLKAVFLGKQIRHSLRVQLAEENSEVELFGLAKLQGVEEAHVHVLVEHMAPHTRSRQHFKNVLKGKSRASFEGKIYVQPIAQKTEAYQLNNNLVLSDEAHSFAKPNLEIFADDVKASHGATTGQLNEEELFYLRSRGLKLEAAREWLIEGFCKEILDHAR